MILSLFINPLASYSVEEDEIRLIFDQYNQAKLNLDFDEMKKYKTRVDNVSEIYKCIEDPECGPGLINKMKIHTLTDYDIVNFVEFSDDRRILQRTNPDIEVTMVNGPAAHLDYEGINLNGRKGKGNIGFIIEDGVWKVSGMSWKPEPIQEVE